MRETLQFYADLKLPSSVSFKDRQARVEEVIRELGLQKVADSRVGTQFSRGISGGEKKRLSIGSQLITDPGLLFLDEPTTGLDAYNSQGVIEVLRRLCERGRTIIWCVPQALPFLNSNLPFPLSQHDPSAQIYNLRAL